MLKVNCSNVSYPAGKIVIERANLLVERGQTIGIMGPSGSGKSTLLRIIAGLELGIEGHIEIEGAGIVAMLFQDYDCYPWMSVWDNIVFSSRLSSRNVKSLEGLLQQFGLFDWKTAWPWQLSGGMRKRLGLLRALVSQSDVILLDEPFSSLDFNTKLQICDVLLQTIRKEHKQVVLISHDVDDLVMLADSAVISKKAPLTLSNPISRSLEYSNAGSAHRRLDDMDFRKELIQMASPN
jgi:NitT/TauT family transport system ATP-binding protein